MLWPMAPWLAVQAKNKNSGHSHSTQVSRDLIILLCDTCGLFLIGQAVAVAQHHDAVSGTAKQHVTNDYAKQLSIGWDACQIVMNNAFANLLGSTENFIHCTYLNISACLLTEAVPAFRVIIYNPLARSVDWNIRLPVNGSHYSVVAPDGQHILNEIIPVSSFTRAVRHNRGSATNELVFQASLPPLGYRTYSVSQLSGKDSARPRLLKRLRPQPAAPLLTPSIENEHLQVLFDPNTGLMKEIQNLDKNISLPLSQSFLWYNASVGNTAVPQASGAYIFRPNTSKAFPIAQKVRVYQIKVGKAQSHLLQICLPSNPGALSAVLRQDAKKEKKIPERKGPLFHLPLSAVWLSITQVVQELYQNFSNWCSQVVRLYAGQPYVELEWTVGPIPIADHYGKEIISRFETNLQTGGLFYTDSNGREILERRRRDYRVTWNLSQTEPVAGNYYPVNTRMYIKDQKTQLTVLTDRSQGGSSLTDGSLELMVHRRLLHDDNRGVQEPLLEPGEYHNGLVVRGRHLIFLDTVESSAEQHRLWAQQEYMAPQVVLTPDSHDIVKEFSALRHALPSNVHLLTLAQWEPDAVLIRLEHQFEYGEAVNGSLPVAINLLNLFSSFNIISVQEMNLSANQKRENVSRLIWQSTQGIAAERQSGTRLDPAHIELSPMQIRTFLLQIKY
ncbi:hypothetical protein E2320_015703 [Naja naja]|nr:hypothetical protein E2320_015703 [Naja naja]